MPRESVKFTKFDGGAMLSVDPQDIPPNASPYCTDCEPPSKSGGRLIGVLAASEVTHSNPEMGSARGVGHLVRPNGSWDMIYREAEASQVYVVRDVENVKTWAPLGYLPDPTNNELYDTPCFIEDGAVLRIGRGPYENAETKWVGYPSVSLTGSGATGEAAPKMVDDRCLNLSQYPFFYKVVTDNTYIWGAEFGGDRLHRVTISNGAVTETPLGQHTRIISISKGYSNSIYVLEDIAGTLKISRITNPTSTMDTITNAWTLTGISLSSDLEGTLSITDMDWISGGDTYGTIFLLYTGERWKSGRGPMLGGPTEDFLWKHAMSSLTSGDKAFTDVSPNTICEHNADYPLITPTAGHWYYVYDHAYDAEYKYTYPRHVCKQGLIPLSSTQMGIAFNVTDPNSNYPSGHGPLGMFYRTDVATTYQMDNTTCLWVVGTSFTKGGYAPIIVADNITVTGYNAGWHYYEDATNGSLYLTRSTLIARRDLDSDKISPLTAAGDYYNTTTTLYDGLFSKYILGCPVYAVGGDVFIARSIGNYEAYYSWAPYEIGEIREGISRATGRTMTGWANDDWLNSNLVTLERADGASGTENFIKDKFYHYKICFEYDGFQYSPLSPILVYHDATSTGKSAVITLVINDANKVSPRATAVLLFKAYANSAYGEMLTQYRLVKRVPFAGGDWATSTTSGITSAEAVVVDSISDHGALFEAMSGFSETLPHTWVNYGSGVLLNNYLFVGSCYTKDVDDSSSMVFRSKPFRYSTFDWSQDFIKLPEPIIGIGQYAGRVYAFAWDRCYIINPMSLRVEETVEGMGTVWHHSIVSTEVGLFVAGEKHVYWSDGRQHKCISYPIEENVGNPTFSSNDMRYGKSSSTDWIVNARPILLWEPIYSCLGVFVVQSPAGGYTARNYLFYPTNGSWWPLLSVAPATGFTWVWSFGTRLEASYLTFDTPPADQKWAKLFSSTTERINWAWATPEILSGNRHKARVYQINTVSDGTGFVVQFMDDRDAAWTTATTVTAGKAYTTGSVTRPYSLLLYLYRNTTGLLSNVQEIEVVKRDMVGIR